jgi:hypothetical protein
MVRYLLAGVACLPMLSPSVVRAGEDDGVAALAVLMGVAAEAVAAKVRIEDKAFIDQCTDAAIEKWRKRNVSVNMLFEGQRLEDQCVAEAVAMEIGRVKAKADADALIAHSQSTDATMRELAGIEVVHGCPVKVLVKGRWHCT